MAAVDTLADKLSGLSRPILPTKGQMPEAGATSRRMIGRHAREAGSGMATPRNQSVQKAFALLHAFRGPGEWVTSAELSRRARLPEASAHRLIRTLEEIGALVRDRRGCYRPGMALAMLSRDIGIGEMVRATCEDILTDLARRLKAVMHVGVLERGMVTYAAKFGEPARGTMPSRVGAQQEAYCSAVGKVLLAGLPAQQFEDFLLDGDLVPLTSRTITSAPALRTEIAEVRARGYAVDNREVSPEICCLGVPISDPDGNTVAAISLADHADNLGHMWEEEAAGQLLAAAGAINRKIFPFHSRQAAE
jgi:DNA-binding IclR family transcriptional regulator